MRSPTPAQIKQWREAHRLTQAQLGALAGASIQLGVGAAGARAGKGRRTEQCVAAWRWENGEREMPPATWELLQVKGVLLETKRASFEELTDGTAHQIIRLLLASRGR
jgi:transcriptional regulator with XRE-family HTH domain